jgi:hypothetical protein
MAPRDKRPADTAVFVVACIITLGLAIEAGYRYGVEEGFAQGQSIPLVCAKVFGMTPVSSTATSCTYIMGTQGRAYWRELARR